MRSSTAILRVKGSFFGSCSIKPAIKSCGRNQPALMIAGISPITRGESVRVAAKTGKMVLTEIKLSPKMNRVMSMVLTYTLCLK